MFNAVCLIRAAGLAYRSFDYTKIELERCGDSKKFRFFKNTSTDTQAFGLSIEGATLIAFRGTETKNFSGQVHDLLTDAKISHVQFGPHQKSKVHSGFLEAVDSIWDEVSEFIQENTVSGDKLWFTGHSLGAALATLAAAKIVFDNDTPYEIGGLYTIGQPRTGNKYFKAEFDKRMRNKIIRIVNNNDLVTMIPLPIGYRHIGGFHYINRAGTFSPDIKMWKVRHDRFLGIAAFAFFSLGKLLLARFTFFKPKFQSIIADHDKDQYLASIKEYRDYLGGGKTDG